MNIQAEIHCEYDCVERLDEVKDYFDTQIHDFETSSIQEEEAFRIDNFGYDERSGMFSASMVYYDLDGSLDYELFEEKAKDFEQIEDNVNFFIEDLCEEV